MRLKIIFIILYCLLMSCSSLNKISGIYQHYFNDDGFYDKITIELKENGDFNYREFNEQICYQTNRISKGKWKAKNGVISLQVDEELKPKISFKHNSTVIDTLIIKVFDKNGNNFSDWFSFYGENEKWVYPTSKGSKFKIPLNKGVKKIIFQDKLIIKTKEDFNEIIIENASKEEDIIYDFSTLKLLKKRNYLISAEKIYGPTGKKVRGVFRKIK